jgi:hypothetical protein
MEIRKPGSEKKKLEGRDYRSKQQTQQIPLIYCDSPSKHSYLSCLDKRASTERT